MSNVNALPEIGFSSDASWDTVNSVLLGAARFADAETGWAMDVHMSDGSVLTAMWLDADESDGYALVRPWNESAGDYVTGTETRVALDSITRQVVL